MIIKDLKDKLIDKRKSNTATKKSSALLEKEYRACETVVTMVEEEKARPKIHVKDMREVIDLTETDKQTTHKNIPGAVQGCKECGYPCKTQHDIELHMKKTPK